MKLLALIALTWLIVWALTCAVFNFTKENWQALQDSTRWLIMDAAPAIGVVLLIAGMVLALMLGLGDS